ncbi:MAG: chalcone isomerase family protein, partial [Myxococcales bacterium]
YRDAPTLPGVRMNLFRALLAAVLLAATPASAAELAGVKVPDQVTVAGEALALNGIALRSKFFFKVYVGALYLPEKTTDAKKVITSDAPKQVSMTFLRDLDRRKVADSIVEGFENNSKEQMPTLKARLDRLLGSVRDVKRGDRLVITWIPGEGTLVETGGETMKVEGKDFAEALFTVWLGPKPADEDLKRGLLGL